MVWLFPNSYHRILSLSNGIWIQHHTHTGLAVTFSLVLTSIVLASVVLASVVLASVVLASVVLASVVLASVVLASVVLGPALVRRSLWWNWAPPA